MNKETRTYEITSDANTLNKIERMLRLMEIMGSQGSTRAIEIEFDGDGPDRLKVENDIIECTEGASRAIQHGLDVSVFNEGFIVTVDKYGDTWTEITDEGIETKKEYNVV